MSAHDTGEATQLKQELINVLRRYSQESDVTICQALGVLDIVKAEMIQEMLAPCDTPEEFE
jgi:hypothetical protein